MTCGEENMGSLKRRVKEFEDMLVTMFEENYAYCSYTLKYQLLHHMKEVIRRFLKLSILNSSLYEHFNVHIRQAYKKTSRKRMKRNDENGKRDGGKLQEVSVIREEG